MPTHPVLFPSGSFVRRHELERGTPSELVVRSRSDREEVTEVFNPTFAPEDEPATETVDEADGDDITRFVSEFQSGDVRTIAQWQIDDYARQLASIGQEFARANYDDVFIPLRGAYFPWLQIEVIGGEDTPHTLLPFSAGSQGTWDARVLQILSGRLRALVDHGKEAKIAILDTAISGDSAVQLAKLVADAYSAMHRPPPITCDIHLIHEVAKFPARVSDIVLNPHETLTFVVRPRPVGSLLIEDWEPAIGFEFDAGGSTVVIKPSVCSGRAIIREAEGARLIESDNLHGFFRCALSNAVSEDMRGDPNLRLSKIVYSKFYARR